MQSQIGPKPLLIHSSRKQKIYSNRRQKQKQEATATICCQQQTEAEAGVQQRTLEAEEMAAGKRRQQLHWQTTVVRERLS